MALTYKGFSTSQMDEEDWALYMGRLGELSNQHGIVSGGSVSAGGGTREVSVSALAGILPGLLVDTSGAEIVSGFAANGSGFVNRIDTLVIRGTWGSTRTAAFAIVQGSSATTAPALTQTAGALWEMPLADVTVRPGVTTFLGGDIKARKPTRRRDIPYLLSPSGQELPGAGSQQTLATQAIPDPGWPYYVEVNGMLHVVGDSGYTRVDVYQGATGIGFGASSNTSEGAKSSVPVVGASATLTGPQTVTVKARVMDAGSGADTTVLASRVLLTVKPA